MKFNKQINNGTLLIPGGAFKISGFEGGEKVEIHTLDSAVVVLKKQMTTMELIQAMDALHRLATELTVHPAELHGKGDSVMRLAGDAVDPHIHSQVGIVLRADIDLTHYAGADLKAALTHFLNQLSRLLELFQFRELFIQLPHPRSSQTASFEREPPGSAPAGHSWR